MNISIIKILACDRHMSKITGRMEKRTPIHILHGSGLSGTDMPYYVFFLYGGFLCPFVPAAQTRPWMPVAGPS